MATPNTEATQVNSDCNLYQGNIECDEGIKVVVDKVSAEINFDGLRKYFVSRIKQLKKKHSPNPNFNSKLTFPSSLQLAIFSSIAYCRVTSDAENELDNEVDLQEWHLLCLVESGNNYYRGALFFHPNFNHIVVAHRGTAQLNQWVTTNLVGIALKRYVSEVNSAATFAHSVLNAVSDYSNQNKKIHFEIFFTGHSLGAWLAQITTLSSKYLKMNGRVFIRNNQQQRFHVHCSTFDDPGCKKMLEKVAADIVSVRYPQEHLNVNLKTLDIKNYLMQPNKENKFELHVGNLYLIPGNSSSHSRKDIISALKKHKVTDIQVIEHWPLLTITLYDNFFGDYKATKFDPCKCLLNVFNYEQQKFLREFLVLRDIHGYELPKVPKYALSTLKEYSIGEFYVEFSSGLIENFIPLVGLLLKHCPQINNEIVELLSKADVRQQFYQKQSLKIDSNGNIQFTGKWPLNFESAQVHLFSTASIRLKLIEMYHWIKVDDRYKDSHTIFDLNKLLIINESSNFIDFVASMGNHLVIIECTTKTNKISEKTKNLFAAIKTFISGRANKANKTNERGKIVFVAHKDDSTMTDHLKNLFSIVPKVEASWWSRLTDSSRTYHLDKKINFHQSGKSSKLEDLLTNYENVLDDDEIIGILLDDDQLTIGMREQYFHTFGACQQKFYYPIPKDFSAQVTGADSKEVPLRNFCENLTTDHFLEDTRTEVKDVSSMVKRGSADAAQAFRKLCLENSEKTFYWIGPTRGSEVYYHEAYCPSLYIKRQFGKKGAPQKETDKDNILPKDCISEDDIKKFDRVEIIVDEPGMGKSTTLTSLCAKIDSPWIIRMNLKECSDAIAALPESDNNVTIDIAMKFLSNATSMELDVPLAQKLFRYALEGKTKKPIYLLFDAVDEINDALINMKFKNEKERNQGLQRFIALIKYLKKEKNSHIWITTREHRKEVLKKDLGECRYFIRLSKKAQIEYLKTSWKLRLTFCRQNFEEIDEKISKYAEDLLKDAEETMSEEILNFIGVPLQLTMLKEAFAPKADVISSKWYDYTKQVGNLSNIYQTFIEKKFQIWLLEKIELSVDSAAKCKPLMMGKALEMHRTFAFRMLAVEEAAECLSPKETQEQDEHLDALFAIGLMTYEGEEDGNTKYDFLHRTFAEYFLADLIYNCIRYPANIPYRRIEDFVIFLIQSFNTNPSSVKLVRVFLDQMLGKLIKSDPDYASTFQYHLSNVGFFSKIIHSKTIGYKFGVEELRTTLEKFNPPLNLLKFEIEILFKKNCETLWSLTYGDDHISIVNFLYDYIIGGTLGMAGLSIIFDTFPVSIIPSSHYPDPLINSLISNKEETSCGFFSAASVAINSLHENSFKISESKYIGTNKEYLLHCIQKNKFCKTAFSVYNDDDELHKLLNNSNKIKQKLENDDSQCKWTFCVFTCERRDISYLTSFVMEHKSPNTIHILHSFSDWKLMLKKTYDNKPSERDMWEAFKIQEKILKNQKRRLHIGDGIQENNSSSAEHSTKRQRI